MLCFILPVALLIAPILSVSETTTPNTSTVSSNSNEEPLDVQDHPNLGLLPNECGFMNAHKLLNGNRTKPNEMPWMVLLSYHTDRGNRLGCVGTLINERYVLTAAQCVSFLGNNTLNSAILGEYDVRTDPDCENTETEAYCHAKVTIATIEEVIAHPGYSLGGSRQTLIDDIALIRLATPADFEIESLGPVCLPVTPALQAESLDGLDGGLVAGWNLNGFKVFSPVLEKHSVSTISNEECQLAYNNGTTSPPLITSRHICVKSHDGGDDPGGPLIYPDKYLRYIQHGIVSFGPRFKKSKLPEVYTKVAYYMKWILDNIKN